MRHITEKSIFYILDHLYKSQERRVHMKNWAILGGEPIWFRTAGQPT